MLLKSGITLFKARIMKEHIDISLRLLAAGFISKQLAKLMMHLQDARLAEDIEDIHQARVACRRIRAALRLFHDCFESEVVSTWQKQIKKLLKSFGAARDLDVQIEFLKSVLDNLDSDQKKMRPGIRRMMMRWQQQREMIQSRVVKTIDNVQKKHLLTNIHIHMEKTLFELKPLRPSTISPAVRQRAYDQIQTCIRDFLEHEQSLHEPDNISGHHTMRIRAKKLRYAMEISDTALRGKLKTAIKKVKKIQTILGDMHDCDVWDTDIDRFIEAERTKTIDFYGHSRPFARILPGLLYLQQERDEHRNQLYLQARDFMEQLDKQAFWDTFPKFLKPDNDDQKTIQSDVESNESNSEVQDRDPV